MIIKFFIQNEKLKMSDNDQEYYGYNDEYSDNNNDNNNDEQDEQRAQNLNGKIETLQQKVEELQRELTIEKIKYDDSQKHYDKEIKSLRKSMKEDSNESNHYSELEKLKNQNEKLKDQLDLAISVNGGSSGISHTLKTEFVKFCSRNKIFLDLTEKDMTDHNCIKILSSQINPKSSGGSKRTAANDGASLQSMETGSGSEQQLMVRIRDLEEELRLALGAAEDIRALKAKVMQMMERNRIEKETRLRVDIDLQTAKKKVDMLTDHMEKLMMHLKHEAASKIRVSEQLRVSERENIKIKEKCEIMSRKGFAKDRLILELREGSKVLEDQLRLMDEKFLELRTKLDWARELGTKKVKKAEKTAKELRTKFALLGNNSLLDNVPLPSIHTGMGMELSGHVSFYEDNNGNYGNGMKSKSKSVNSYNKISSSMNDISVHSDISENDRHKKKRT